MMGRKRILPRRGLPASHLGKPPVDRFAAMGFEEGVRLGEMPAAKKAGMGRKRRWMHGFQDEMALGIDERRLLLCVRTPEHEDDGMRLFVDGPDDRIGEPLPAAPLMRRRPAFLDSKDAVEQ